MASKDSVEQMGENNLRPPLWALDWTKEQIKLLEAILPPSAERVVGFVENLLHCPGAGQLRRLAITSLFKVIARDSGRVRRSFHSSATEQQDVFHIACDDPDRGITVYCYRPHAVTRAVIDQLMPSAVNTGDRPAHIIFITTETIETAVRDYATSLYQTTGGIEFAILDCIGFVRHFLHLFHRHRVAFLDAYQALVLSEPDSAVSFALKQAFLALRQAAISEAEPSA